MTVGRFQFVEEYSLLSSRVLSCMAELIGRKSFKEQLKLISFFIQTRFLSISQARNLSSKSRKSSLFTSNYSLPNVCVARGKSMFHWLTSLFEILIKLVSVRIELCTLKHCLNVFSGSDEGRFSLCVTNIPFHKI